MLSTENQKPADSRWGVRCGAADGTPRENYIPPRIYGNTIAPRRLPVSGNRNKRSSHLRLIQKFQNNGRQLPMLTAKRHPTPTAKSFSKVASGRSHVLVLTYGVVPQSWRIFVQSSRHHFEFPTGICFEILKREIRGMFLDPAAGIHWGYFHLLKSRKFSVNLPRPDAFACGLVCSQPRVLRRLETHSRLFHSPGPKILGSLQSLKIPSKTRQMTRY